MEQNKTDKIRLIWTKIMQIKNIKLIIAALLVAIIMLSYGINASKRKSTSTVVTESKKITETKKDTGIDYTDEEEKLADILSLVDGVGETKVLITYNTSQEINGVIVVAEGAENPLTEWKIRHAVQTALKVDYHSVEVYSMN